MLTALDRLALEVTRLEPAASFYRDRLGLEIRRQSSTEVTFAAGETDLVLRVPGPVPRGGLHTHYAFSAPREEYDDWRERLASHLDLVEHDFGDARSLYFDDPAGHCVEIGGRSGSGSGITGIFEIVLEVEDLAVAEDFYRHVAASVLSRGDERRRIRLDLGAVDLELWEPQLGIADGRGGVHVDVGFRARDPAGVAATLREDALSTTRLDDGVRIRDPDGHYLTVRDATSPTG